MVVYAISGMPGCGSSSVGRLLAEKLGLKFESMGKRFKSHAEGINETQKAIDMYKGKGGKKDFHEDLDNQQRKIAEEGNVVIDGKLAIYIIGDRADFKVWLTAPFETRVRRIARRELVGLASASKLLKKKEKGEWEVFKKVYGIDFLTQEKKADLVIDTSDKTPEQIVELILEKSKR